MSLKELCQEAENRAKQISITRDAQEELQEALQKALTLRVRAA